MEQLTQKKPKNVLYVNAIGSKAISIATEILGNLNLGSLRTSNFEHNGEPCIKYSFIVKNQIELEVAKGDIRNFLIKQYSNDALLLYQNGYNLFIFEKFNF